MLRIYSLFDRKMREFGALVLAPTDEAVKRALLEAFRGRGNSTMTQYPEDFDLHCVGMFDEASGKVFATEGATFLEALEVIVAHLYPAPPVTGIGLATQMESSHGA